jgi:hypothetical protein
MNAESFTEFLRMGFRGDVTKYYKVLIFRVLLLTGNDTAF